MSHVGHNQVSTSTFNNHLTTEIPLRENYTYEGEFPDIKPPITTTSSTRHGECLVIAGSESLFPLIVQTTSSSNPTLPGGLLALIPINPQLLSGTRLNKLAENYTFWYPKELVVEYVPLGSALDRGSIISVPTLDPEDTFSTGDPNSIIRRALSYERSVSFNVYDKPQFLLPPTESDDLFYITPGQNARQEISHVWHALAQTSYSPVNDETSIALGWFKLHYIIELYEPRLLDSVVMPSVTFSTPVTRLTLHGGSTSVGSPVYMNLDYVTDRLTNSGDPSRTIWQLFIRSYAASASSTFAPAEVRFADRIVTLSKNQTFFIRVQDVNPSYALLYDNLSDCFNNSNPASWEITQTAANLVIDWTSTALQVDQ